MLPSVEITNSTRANLAARDLTMQVNQLASRCRTLLTTGLKGTPERPPSQALNGALIPGAAAQPEITAEEIRAALAPETLSRLSVIFAALTADDARVAAALKALA